MHIAVQRGVPWLNCPNLPAGSNGLLIITFREAPLDAIKKTMREGVNSRVLILGESELRCIEQDDSRGGSAYVVDYHFEIRVSNRLSEYVLHRQRVEMSREEREGR